MEESTFENEIKYEFLNEAGELVEDIESVLLDLEKNPEDSESIDQIFRCAHTVKGSAYAAGFTHLAEFGHVFETLLGLLRSGKAVATNEIIDTLLKSVDITKEYVTVLNEDMEGFLDTEEVVAELTRTIEEIDGPMEKKEESDLPAFGFFDDDEDEVEVEVEQQVNTVEEAKPTNIPPAMSTKTKHLTVKEIVSKTNSNILIVDDDKGVLGVLSEIVGSVDGVNVTTAADGVIGLDEFKNGEFDLILSDLNMPNMDGIEMIDKIREIDKSIPICMISGHANRENIITLISQGVYAFIDKPFETNMITLTVENALKSKRTKDGLTALSKANFKAFIGMNRHLAKYKKYDEDTLKKEELRLKKELDQIAVLTNHLIKI